MNENRLSRRSFIRNTSLVAAGAIAAGMGGKDRASAQTGRAVDTSKILNYNPKMGYRRLGIFRRRSP